MMSRWRCDNSSALFLCCNIFTIFKTKKNPPSFFSRQKRNFYCKAASFFGGQENKWGSALSFNSEKMMATSFWA